MLGLLVAGCGAGSGRTSVASIPDSGLALYSLTGNQQHQAASIGHDVVAVIVSGDGSTAYLADSEPGDVFAVALPALTVEWKTHTGGAPFGLLLHKGRLDVTLYDDAAIDELDPATGAVTATYATVDHPGAMTVDASGQLVVAGGGDFGTATVDGDVWMADYARHEIFDLTHPRRVALPLPVSPFWLSAGADGTLLIAAEGAHEDADPGAVFSYDPMSGTFHTLARPRDPDQVVQSGATVFVAAHGDRAVLAIGDHHTDARAQGWSPVAVAPDPELGMLLIAQNAHE